VRGEDFGGKGGGEEGGEEGLEGAESWMVYWVSVFLL